MSKSVGTETIELTIEWRTWRVEIFCEKGDVPRVVCHREKVWTRPDGTVAQRDRSVVTVARKLSQVASQEVAGITGANLAAAIAAWADTWHDEDVAEAARIAAENTE